MPDPDVAISVQSLAKRYRLGEGPASDQTFGEMLYHRAGALARRFRGAPPAPPRHCWALQDVACKVRRGEVFGVIGRNGAGKSTLLRILSRITPPTQGRVELRGRVGSLLEVGTGFHPELTGRENVFLNGAILGMTRREVRAKFDDIVAFAEVEKFLDTPVKRYSSGMSVRLAFAVAAFLEPEVLLIDEVLAVGDAGFQRKCLGRMNGIAHGGRTVVFVSHDMGAVATLCDRVMVLDHGRVDIIAPPHEAIARYRELVASWRDAPEAVFRGTLTKSVRIDDVSVNGESAAERETAIDPAEPVRFRVAGDAATDVTAFRAYVALFRDGVRVCTLHDLREGRTLPAGPFTSEIEVPPFTLRPGRYEVTVGGHCDGLAGHIRADNVAGFEIGQRWSAQYGRYDDGLVNIAGEGRRTTGQVTPPVLEVAA